MNYLKTLFSLLTTITVLFRGQDLRADWWQDCASERDQFCKGVPAGGGRVANCIDEHWDELSPKCRSSRPSNAKSVVDRNKTPINQRNTNELPVSNNSGFKTAYQTDFSSGLDNRLTLQQPTPSSITLARAACQPSKPSVRVSINKSDDYSRVANGVPRAEISFAGRLNFSPGNEYLIQWSTCLPQDFRFDTRQPEGITQIHEGVPKGSPPWGIVLAGNRYQVQLRDGSRVQTRDVGDATNDLGRWVTWNLRYRPDSSGANAITELRKDGAPIFSANGIPNAYPNDYRSYLKIGIYKWWWKDRPSDVSERTMYFGDVRIENR